MVNKIEALEILRSARIVKAWAKLTPDDGYYFQVSKPKILALIENADAFLSYDDTEFNVRLGDAGIAYIN